MTPPFAGRVPPARGVLSARLRSRAHPRLALVAILVLGAGAPACTLVRHTVPPASQPRQASLESRIWHEVNLARSDPSGMADYLGGWLSDFDGTGLIRPGRRRFLMKEGRPAVEEAIRFLRAHRPVPPLSFSAGMSSGARDLVLDLGPRAVVSHVGSDGSLVKDRVARYGTIQRKAAELIQFGTTDAREIVALLIVDDGVPGRGHRWVLFDDDYHVMGVALGPHAGYRSMCVITLAAGYQENLAGLASNGDDSLAW